MDRDRALRNVTQANNERNELTQRGDRILHNAITAARDAGCTYRQIGQAIGMSHVGVMKLLQRP